MYALTFIEHSAPLMPQVSPAVGYWVGRLCPKIIIFTVYMMFIEAREDTCVNKREAGRAGEGR